MSESDDAMVERCAIAHFAAWAEITRHPFRGSVAEAWAGAGETVQGTTRASVRAVLVEAGLLDFGMEETG